MRLVRPFRLHNELAVSTISWRGCSHHVSRFYPDALDMPTFDKKTRMPVSADALYRWHMEPGAFDRLIPPWQEVEVLERPDVLEEGARLVMKIYFIGPVGMRWVALHRDFVEGRQFVDEQLEGPFAEWVHTHRFEPVSDDESMLHDHVEYEPPLGALGRTFGRPVVERMLERMFDYRHEVTRKDLSEKRDER